MKPFHLITGGTLAVFLAGGAAAQFNTDALKKMQKEGHKIVEEQQAAETARAGDDAEAAGSAVVRHAYRFGGNLCLDARGVLSAETCNGKAAPQHWALEANGRFVAHDGRCLDGASLVPCAGNQTQKWVHDARGRLRNQAKQCLQPRHAQAGAPVIAAPCSGASTQLWTEIKLAG